MTNTVLITGATSGIGLELARLLANSHRLVLIGRKSPDALSDERFTQDTYCQADLSSPESVPIISSFLVRQNIQRLHLVIHNAAVGFYGTVEAQPDDKLQALLQTNLYSPIHLTQAVLPLMKPSDKLVFVSSVAASLPVPDYAVYGASKAALSGFARNLRLELGNAPAVQVIYPGAVRTDMHRKSGVPEDKLNSARFPSAAQVAAQILQASRTRRREVTLGLANRLLRLAGRFLSDPLDFLAGLR